MIYSYGLPKFSRRTDKQRGLDLLSACLSFLQKFSDRYFSSAVFLFRKLRKSRELHFPDLLASYILHIHGLTWDMQPLLQLNQTFYQLATCFPKLLYIFDFFVLQRFFYFRVFCAFPKNTFFDINGSTALFLTLCKVGERVALSCNFQLSEVCNFIL